VCPGAQHCAAGACKESSIKHVVLIVQENHTFDSYFGRYCHAKAGSNPVCTAGRDCCEAAPDTEPRGAKPITLDDAANFASDTNHSQACEILEINGGKMDGFVDGTGIGSTFCTSACSRAANWAIADEATVGTYWGYADKYALADRYFQPVAGGSASNNMYFAVAHFQFLDNEKLPVALNSGCVDTTGICVSGAKVSYTGRRTVADLLLDAGKTFAVYADGYQPAVDSAPSCSGVPSDCGYSCITHPIACRACIYDPSDIPFAYYGQLGDKYIKDYSKLEKDVAAGTLPSFAYVKAREFRNEHPNVSKISDGIAFVDKTVQMILTSAIANETLILLTWDEGGGFFDHVSPPLAIDTDDRGQPVPYGTRVPLLAIGPFAKKGTVSHDKMEHSSVVRFLEYNFVGPVGQLKANDAKVNNLGSLLDVTKTGIRIPSN
jgi:phospholipase C